ncbi:protein CANDIDATE G-PROTEIN COUPLED RECEPTOR [Trifolium repens]|nr:protein CANDIDATE G-PROTEIN COUPLED RECEPTOR [Trifolium repens]
MAKTAITTVVSLITILFLATTPPSTAEIKSLTITSDTRPMILFEKFGFTHSGHVRIAVSEVSVAAGASQPDPSRLGFFLLSEESLLQVLIEIQQNPSLCVLDSQYITHLFTFRDLSPPPTASFNHSYPVTYPNEFSLFVRSLFFG